MKELNINLTDNETKLLELCLTYDDRENQLIDNYTSCTFKDVMKALNWNAFQVGGLLSSLITKHLIDGDQDDFYITEQGVNAIFDIIELKNN